jgi:hypothetical protein
MPLVIGGRLTTRPVARPRRVWGSSLERVGALSRDCLLVPYQHLHRDPTKSKWQAVPCVRGGKSAVDQIEAVNDVLIKYGKPGIAATASRNSKCC